MEFSLTDFVRMLGRCLHSQYRGLQIQNTVYASIWMNSRLSRCTRCPKPKEVDREMSPLQVNELIEIKLDERPQSILHIFLFGVFERSPCVQRSKHSTLGLRSFSNCFVLLLQMLDVDVSPHVDGQESKRHGSHTCDKDIPLHLTVSNKNSVAL